MSDWPTRGTAAMSCCLHSDSGPPPWLCCRAPTSASGRSCACIGLSRRPSHRVHSPGPPRLHHHPFHFCWPQPQNTAALLDTEGTQRGITANTESSRGLHTAPLGELSSEMALGPLNPGAHLTGPNVAWPKSPRSR